MFEGLRRLAAQLDSLVKPVEELLSPLVKLPEGVRVDVNTRVDTRVICRWCGYAEHHRVPFKAELEVECPTHGALNVRWPKAPNSRVGRDRRLGKGITIRAVPRERR